MSRYVKELEFDISCALSRLLSILVVIFCHGACVYWLAVAAQQIISNCCCFVQQTFILALFCGARIQAQLGNVAQSLSRLKSRYWLEHFNAGLGEERPRVPQVGAGRVQLLAGGRQRTSAPCWLLSPIKGGLSQRS